MADQIKIQIDVETRDAIAALARVAKATEQVEKETKKLSTGQAVWKTLNTDVDKLGGAFEKAHPRMHAFGSSAMNVAKGVGAGSAAILGLGAALVQFAAHAEEQELTLRRLGSAYDAVSAATNGAFSAQQALSLQGQIQASGVRVNAQQLGVLARAAREYAQATGEDASAAVEKLTNAIVNNSEDALSELGLSQARATSSTQTLANMVRELETRYRGVAPAARTLNEDLAKLPDVFTSIGAAALGAARTGLEAFINRMTDSSTAGRRFFDGVRRGWTDVVELGDTMRTLDAQSRSNDAAGRRSTLREGILNRARTLGVRATADDLQGLNEARLTALSRQLDAGFGVNGRVDINAAFSQIAGPGAGLASGAYEGMLARLRGEMDRESRKPAEGRTGGAASTAEQRLKDAIAKDLSNAAGGAADVFERTAKRIETANIGRALEGLTLSAKRTAGFFGSMRDGLFAAQGINPMNEANDLAVGAVGAGRALRNRYQTIGNALGLNSATDDESADLFNSIADAQEGGGAAAREARARRSRIAGRDRETRRMARNESFAGRLTAGLGMERDDEGNLRGLNALDLGAKGLVTTLGTLQSGFAEFFTSVASGAMSAGDAAAVMGVKLLNTLGQVAIQEGTVMLFKAIPAAIEAPPLAAAYLAGGLGLVGLGAGLTAAGAAAMPPKPNLGASASGDRNARAIGPRSSSSLDRGGGYGDTTVVLASLVPAGVVDATNARNGLRRLARAGLDDKQRIPRAVEF
jgi:hypothetical protein